MTQVKQERIPFPDYPAVEQEFDSQRIKLPRHIYLLKIENEWAHFVTTLKGDDYKFYGDKTLTEVYHTIKENYPDYKPRVLEDNKLKDYLRERKPKDLQLRIPFNEVRRLSQGTTRE